MPKTSLTLLLLGLALPLMAQLPKSNVYLFNIRQVSDSIFEFTKPRFLTAFNAQGYNNQPAFFSNNEIYLSVQMPGMAQPDLYLLDIDKQTKVRVTRTNEGEFSPARTPDYYSFSAVRQEISGRDTVLRLWQFPIDRLANGRPVFKYLRGIGYYSWLSGKQIAVFVLGNPNYLGLANVDSDEVVPIATTVGRSFQKLPNGNLAYVQKGAANAPWLIMEKNLFRRDLQPQRITTTVPGSEDFVVLPDGTFLMGRGTKIFKFNQRKDRDWVEIADLRFYNINNITRLAISNDYKLAVVAD